MEYHFSKFKFSSGFFYNRIQLATLEHTSGIFRVNIIPYFAYSGKYHIHSVVEKDSNRTLFKTMKISKDTIGFENLDSSNQYFISLSHDGNKAMIFQKDLDGIILKS